MRPLPGIAGDRLLEILQYVQTTANELRAETFFSDRLRAYTKWANRAAAALGRVVMPEDVTRLVTTPRYWALHAVDPSQEQHEHMLDLEIDERMRALEEEVETYQNARRNWEQTPGVLVVPDTNVFLHHRDSFEVIDWPAVAGARMNDVLLVLPLIVIDELDRAKRGQQRSRARQALKVIDRLFGSSPSDAPYVAEATPSTGVVRCVLVPEEPGHVRLQIADDEIVDQARAVQDFTGRHVKIASFDTSMRVRTRLAGLEPLMLDPDCEV